VGGRGTDGAAIAECCTTLAVTKTTRIAGKSGIQGIMISETVNLNDVAPELKRWLQQWPGSILFSALDHP
jgi:hypothetical protein